MTHFKYIYKSLALVACTSLFTACLDKLDEVPDNRTEIDSPIKVASLLTSAYPNHTPSVICELSGDNYVDDNIVVPATHNAAFREFHDEAYQWKDINNYGIGEQDTPYSVWQSYYGGIAVCNHAIAAMKEMSSDPANDPQFAASWGEAHVLRAYLHFILVNVFAESYKNEAMSSAERGVPYVTDPEEVVKVDYSTSKFLHSVKETYDCIEKDMLEGLPLIDDGSYKVSAYHFNRNAANAFAARFYLYKRDYAQCVKYATAALGSNPATMLRKWSSLNQNTANSRLQDYNDELAPCNFLIQSTYSLHDRLFSSSRFCINSGTTFTSEGRTWTIPSTIDILYGGGGPNWNGYLPSCDGNLFLYGKQEYGIFLFTVNEYFEYTDKIAGIGYVHILYHPLSAEETLLCRAEANLYLGNRDEAIKDLEYWTGSKMVSNPLTLAGINRKYNRLAGSAYCSDLHPAEMGFEKILTGDDLAVLDCVLHFRRIETHFEGLRWFDIKRYGITVYHHYRGPKEDDIHTDSLVWSDPRRVLQLPKNVIDAGYPENRGESGSTGGNSSGMIIEKSKNDFSNAISTYVH